MINIVKIKLKIGGMHCSSCAANLDLELEDLEGVISAKTSYARQEMEIKYDKKSINIQKIIKKLENLGYSSDEYLGG